MELATAPILRAAVAAYAGLPNGLAEAEAIAAYLRDQGARYVIPGILQDPAFKLRIESNEFDALIVLGGDGTVLRAANLCAPNNIPVLGINMGRFGFLTEIQRGAWQPGLQRLVRGEYRLEKRMMLHAVHQRDTHVLGEWNVVNDVVVCRGQFVRPIEIRARVDGATLANYNADGLIAATPTGSTAYALAVGGPIMPPELRNILIAPVAPHLSMSRAIILSEGACVEMAVYTNHEAVASVDGRPPIPLLSGDCISVGASEHSISFIRFQDPGYFYRNINLYMEQNPITGSSTE